jgi:DNA-binding NarL/FixJ family response regulator
MTQADGMRIVVAHPHPLFIAGLAASLNQVPDMRIVGQATRGDQAREIICDLRPDVAVFDMCLPDIDGFALARRLLGDGLTTGIVGMSSIEERPYLQRAVEAGIRGYVLKRSPTEYLVFAIRSVAEGMAYVDPNFTTSRKDSSANWLSQRKAARMESDDPMLTPREVDVLRRIALGFRNKEIANQLGIGEKTIETYKVRATEKLQLQSRAKIVQYALSHGWF